MLYMNVVTYFSFILFCYFASFFLPTQNAYLIALFTLSSVDGRKKHPYSSIDITNDGHFDYNGKICQKCDK